MNIEAENMTILLAVAAILAVIGLMNFTVFSAMTKRIEEVATNLKLLHSDLTQIKKDFSDVKSDFQVKSTTVDKNFEIVEKQRAADLEYWRNYAQTRAEKTDNEFRRCKKSIAQTIDRIKALEQKDLERTEMDLKLKTYIEQLEDSNAKYKEQFIEIHDVLRTLTKQVANLDQKR